MKPFLVTIVLRAGGQNVSENQHQYRLSFTTPGMFRQEIGIFTSGTAPVCLPSHMTESPRSSRSYLHTVSDQILEVEKGLGTAWEQG